MKIIWAIPIFDNPKTGGEKVFKRLYELLRSRGVSIINVYQESKDNNGALRKLLINIRNFIILMKQGKKALIFQNLLNRPEFLLANIYLCIFRRKIILFIHEVYVFDHLSLVRRKYHSFINYMSFWSASMIVVNSQFTGNWVCNYGEFRGKLFLMYPIIDMGIGNSERLEKTENGSINILCVGNIRRNKGQLYLLQAMEYINRDIEVTFVGLVKEDDYMDKLNKYIINKGISNKVIFAGFLSGQQLSNEYRKADIFVLPTLQEGFGMAVFEAMSFGLPVVVSKTGGVMEQITDGEEGFFVPPGDVKALADKLNKLIADSELRIRMGTLGRDRVTMIPTLNQVCDRFCQVVVDIPKENE